MAGVSNAAQSDQTQRALRAAARALFAERGYGATPTEAIVEQAGVTRGALHYHFNNKVGLFSAVYTEMEGELLQGIVQSMAAQPLESLARLWFGALVEGALYLVQAEDQPTAQADLTQSIARLFTGLRIPS